jgi:hypothetical protein
MTLFVNSTSGDRAGVQHVRGRCGRGLRREHQEVQPQLRVRLLHRGPSAGHPHRQRAQEDHQVHRGTEDDQAGREGECVHALLQSVLPIQALVGLKIQFVQKLCFEPF